MKYESSAGGVIFAFKNHQILILLIKDKTSNWTFPKGLIEKGENSEHTAQREIAEEVGIKELRLIASLKPTQYFYKWEGQLIKKTVYYYVFQNSAEEHLKPQTEEGIMDVKWFPMEKAQEIIGYGKTNKAILDEAKKKIEKINQSTDYPIT